MSKIIGYIAIGVIVTILMNYLNKQSKTKITPNKGDLFMLRLNKLYWHIGIGCIIIGLVGFLLSAISIEGIDGWLIGLICLVFFGGTGAICAIWYRNHQFSFDSNKIEAINVYGNKTVIEWANIKTIKVDALTGLLVFIDNSGEKAKAHQHLIGFNELLKEMENNTNYKIKDLKFPYR